MKLYLIAGIVCLGAIGFLYAQANSEVGALPEGPLLNKLPSNSRCTITVVQTSGPDGKPGKTILQRINMVSSGNLSLVETEDIQNKRKIETWISGEFQILIDSTFEEAVASSTGIAVDWSAAAGEEGKTRKTAPNFPGMESVSKGNFRGIANVGGRACLTFTDSEAEATAYVDLETRLPLAARIIDQEYTYQFSSAPPGSLTLPPKATKAIMEAAERQRRASLQPIP